MIQSQFHSSKNWMGPNPNGPLSCDRAIRYSLVRGSVDRLSDRWRFLESIDFQSILVWIWEDKLLVEIPLPSIPPHLKKTHSPGSLTAKSPRKLTGTQKEAGGSSSNSLAIFRGFKSLLNFLAVDVLKHAYIYIYNHMVIACNPSLQFLMALHYTILSVPNVILNSR